MLDLRLLRRVLGTSQRELGQFLGLNHRRVSEIELGQRAVTLKDARLLLDLLQQRAAQIAGLIVQLREWISAGLGGSQDVRGRR